MTVRIPRWLVLLAALCLAAGVGVTVTLLVSKSHSTPTILAVYDCAHLRERPKRLVFACGDGGAIGKRLSWRDWGERTAVGQGTIAVNDCTPSCAEGSFKEYPIDVTASKIRLCGDGRRQYTAISYSYPNSHPPGISDASLPGEVSFTCDVP